MASRCASEDLVEIWQHAEHDSYSTSLGYSECVSDLVISAPPATLPSPTTSSGRTTHGLFKTVSIKPRHLWRATDENRTRHLGTRLRVQQHSPALQTRLTDTDENQGRILRLATLGAPPVVFTHHVEQSPERLGHRKSRTDLHCGYVECSWNTWNFRIC